MYNNNNKNNAYGQLRREESLLALSLTVIIGLEQLVTCKLLILNDNNINNNNNNNNNK